MTSEDTEDTTKVQPQYGSGMSFGNGGSDSPCHVAVIELVDF